MHTRSKQTDHLYISFYQFTFLSSVFLCEYFITFFLTSKTQRDHTAPPLDPPIQAICIIFRNKDVDFYEMVLISHLWHEIITVSQSTKFVTVLNIVFWTVLLHKCVLLVFQLSVSNF